MKKQNPLVRLWKIGKDYHSGLIQAILFASIGVLCGMLPYWSAAQIIVQLLQQEKEFFLYIPWLLLIFIGFTLRSLLYALALSRSHQATFSILKDIRQKILDKMPKLPLGTILDQSSGKLKQIIVDQVESMETPLAHLLPEMTSNLFGPLCIFIYLFILDWRMALLSLVSIPVGYAFMMIIMKDYSTQYAGSVQVNQEMNESLVEYIQGIEVIKAFNQGQNSYARFRQKILNNASYFYQWMKSCQMPMSLARAIAPTTLITVLPIGWIFYQYGSLTLNTFITTIILSLGIAGPLLEAMNFVDSLARVGTIVDNIESILNAPEQKHSANKVLIQQYDIDVRDISFGYHQDKEVLHHINLHIPQHSMTAIVGPSGSGKSTLGKLIVGFWDVEKGNIQLGHHNLKDIPLSQLYDQVAYVSQDNFLFDDSIRENIRIGNPQASDQEVESIAKQAGCEFIEHLDQGFDTRVGSQGTHLSGGERQRIAIARAMLKNAPIILLDEASAYIDPENEAQLQQALSLLIKNKTVIIIAHRLSTIVHADQIVVLKEGKIQDVGKHQEILQRSSLYQKMWNAHIMKGGA